MSKKKQPKALRLADALDFVTSILEDGPIEISLSSDELRRLQGENEELLKDSERLNWLLMHSHIESDKFSDGIQYITTWISNGEVGNEDGAGGMFIAYGNSDRECIDKFISGNISPI